MFCTVKHSMFYLSSCQIYSYQLHFNLIPSVWSLVLVKFGWYHWTNRRRQRRCSSSWWQQEHSWLQNQSQFPWSYKSFSRQQPTNLYKMVITDKVQTQNVTDFTFVCSKVPFAVSCSSDLPHRNFNAIDLDLVNKMKIPLKNIRVTRINIQGHDLRCVGVVSQTVQCVFGGKISGTNEILQIWQVCSWHQDDEEV